MKTLNITLCLLIAGLLHAPCMAQDIKVHSHAAPEIIAGAVASGSAVSLSNATDANVLSLALTTGVWDVEGNVNFAAGSATITALSAGLSTTSATVPTDGTEAFSGVRVTTTTINDSITLPRKQITLTSTPLSVTGTASTDLINSATHSYTDTTPVYFTELVGGAGLTARTVYYVRDRILPVAQVETATVIGTIGAAGAGNATVIVTAAGMTGSPKTINVAVANNDTASLVAGKIRTALAADVDVTALFTVGGAAANVIITAITAAANDGTLNISTANGTCTGLTAAPSSANTTAGVAGTFKLAATSGGAAIDITTDITSGTIKAGALVYLVGKSSFSAGTVSAFGAATARRVQ